MTDDDPKGKDEPDRPLSRYERAFLRLSAWQTVLAIAGLFTGAVALYATLSEAGQSRQEAKAAVWPYVQTTVLTDLAEDGRPRLTIQFANSGVGPAKVRALRVRLAGQTVRTWEEAMAVAGMPGAPFARNSIARRVIRAGEAVALVSVFGEERVLALGAAASAPDTDVEYCYCSIYDDCWVVRVGPVILDPKPVEACPLYGSESFED